MRRGRRKFRRAERLRCELICPEKVSPCASDQSQRGRGRWRSPARGLAPPSREERPLPEARRLALRLLRASQGAVKTAGGRGMTWAGAKHSTLRLPSITFQTLDIRVFPIPCPPHCPPTVCSIYGIEGLRTVSFFLVAFTVPQRQGQGFTQNMFITLPTSREPPRCALQTLRVQRASDLANVRPARRKAFWHSFRAHPSSPAYDEFRFSLPSSVPFTQGHSPKTRPPRKAVLTGQARALRISSRHHIWLILRV